MDVGIVRVYLERLLVDVESLLGPVHPEEDVAPVDVGLDVVAPPEDGLPVKTVCLLQPTGVSCDEVAKIQKQIQRVRSNSCYQLFARKSPRKQSLC